MPHRQIVLPFPPSGTILHTGGTAEARARPPPQRAASQQWPRGNMYNDNAVAWFADRHVTEGNGARLVFQDPWRALTYRELQAATGRFGGALRQADIERERRIVLLLQDTIDFP